MIARISKAMLSGQFRRLAKEGFWIGLGSALVVLGSLFGVRLLTEVLNPSAYGELALGLTMATLVNQVAMGPLSAGITRFYAPAAEKNDINCYLKGVRKLVLLATLFIIILMVIVLAGLIVLGKTNWIPLTVAAAIFSILSGYDSILNGIQNAARQRIVVALHGAMFAWGRYLIAVGLVLYLGSTSSVAMFGYVLAFIPVLTSQYICFRKILKKSDSTISNQNWKKQIWQYSWPFTTFGLFCWIQLASDRWALELFSTTQEVGFYAVLFQLGYYPMSMASGLSMQLLAPIFYQLAGDGKNHKRNANVNKLSESLTLFCLGLTAVSFLVTLVFHKQIFSIFVSHDYVSVSYYLPWVLLSGGVFAAGQTIALNLMSQMRSHSMIGVKIFTAALGTILNFAGAYLYGLQGIVIASVLFSSTYFAWIFLKSRGIKNGFG